MTDQQPPKRQARQTRGGDGKFTRDADTVKLDAEALRLRKRGRSYRAIADELGINSASAYEAVQRALRETIEEPAAEVRQLELERLDDMQAAVVRVLERQHFTVSHGKIMYHGDDPLLDDAPVLAAVDRLVKIQERRSKLLGLDAPTKAELGGKLTYEILGVDLEKL